MADPGPSTRAFTVRDAMLLVAAAGVGTLGYRSGAARMAWQRVAWVDDMLILGPVTLGGPGLVAVTAALAVLRLLPPRPARVDLFRQPGFAAASAALPLLAAWFAWRWLEDRFVVDFEWWSGREWLEAIRAGATGILVAWATLALAGCLEAERSWIDRSLRAVAVLWLLVGLGLSIAAPLVFHPRS